MTTNWPKLPTVKKIKPLGATTPYIWVIEPVHGCNLRCGHCACRLNEPGKYLFMSEEVWRASWTIIAEVTPTVRVDLCVAGEPTLHPRLIDFLRIARAAAPLAQIQITTNGMRIARGEVRYRDLFDAGVNIVYTDMYAPRERFLALAEESGIPWYEYYDAPPGAPSPWTYHGPALKMIVLQRQPADWPASRQRAGLLGTWYNHLDWKAAARFGLKPVEQPIIRRCNQPFLYANIHVSGAYLLCCQDGVGETAGKFGTVFDGAEGFRWFWYWKEMQLIRRRLQQKNRADTSYCSRCCITFSRCDYKHWTDAEVARFYDFMGWHDLEEDAKVNRFARPAANPQLPLI